MNKNKKVYMTKKRKAKLATRKYLLLIIFGFILPNMLIGYYSVKLEEEITSQSQVSHNLITREAQAEEFTLYEEIAKFSAKTTAYSEIDSCHYPNCAMASGKRAYVGAVACPRNIKLGTKIKIDNVEYVCEDRTSKKYPDRFDIFMGYGEGAYNKAINYGNQTKEIKIYKKTM